MTHLGYVGLEKSVSIPSGVKKIGSDRVARMPTPARNKTKEVLKSPAFLDLERLATM